VIGEVCGSEILAVDEVFRLLADKFFSGQKFAIKGWAGNILARLFERERKNEQQYKNHRLRQFLALVQTPSASLIDALDKGWNDPKQSTSFSESVQVAQYPTGATTN
jgi:hypothetical protein